MLIFRTYKIAIVGPSKVGKSAMICRFLFSKFYEQYSSTIEDSYSARLKYNELLYELDIVDTAGSEDFKDQRDQALKNRDGYIVVYDRSSIESFN